MIGFDNFEYSKFRYRWIRSSIRYDTKKYRIRIRIFEYSHSTSLIILYTNKREVQFLIPIGPSGPSLLFLVKIEVKTLKTAKNMNLLYDHIMFSCQLILWFVQVYIRPTSYTKRYSQNRSYERYFWYYEISNTFSNYFRE